MATSGWPACSVWLGLALGCATGISSEAKPAVRGTVGSVDGFALAPGSQVEVTLADVSRADAAAVWRR